MKAVWKAASTYEGDLTITLEGKEWEIIVQNGLTSLKQNGTTNRQMDSVEDFEQSGLDFEVFWEVISQDLAPYLNKALEMYALDPVSHSKLSVDTMRQNCFSFTYTLQLAKPIQLGQYIGLPYHEEEVCVTQEEVEEVMAQIVQRFSSLEEKDGLSEKGDTVNIDFTGRIDGELFDGGSDRDYNLQLGSDTFIPGFEEQLIGMSAGENRTVTLQFPLDYPARDLMGKTAAFDVYVNRVYRNTTVELTDAFVQENRIFNQESVEGLRQEIYRQRCAMQKESLRQEAEDAMLNRLIDSLEGDAPRALVEQYLQAKKEAFEQQLEQSGLSLEQYFQMSGSTMESLSNDLYESSMRMAKMVAGIEAIAKKEKITVLQEEVEQSLQWMAQQYGLEVNDLQSMVNLNEVKGEILRNKVVDFLVENSVDDHESMNL